MQIPPSLSRPFHSHPRFSGLDAGDPFDFPLEPETRVMPEFDQDAVFGFVKTRMFQPDYDGYSLTDVFMNTYNLIVSRYKRGTSIRSQVRWFKRTKQIPFADLAQRFSSIQPDKAKPWELAIRPFRHTPASRTVESVSEGKLKAAIEQLETLGFLKLTRPKGLFKRFQQAQVVLTPRGHKLWVVLSSSAAEHMDWEQVG